MSVKTRKTSVVKKTPTTKSKAAKALAASGVQTIGEFVLTPSSYRGYPTLSVTRNDDEDKRFRFSWNVGVNKALSLKKLANAMIAWAEAEQAKKNGQ